MKKSTYTYERLANILLLYLVGLAGGVAMQGGGFKVISAVLVSFGVFLALYIKFANQMIRMGYYKAIAVCEKISEEDIL